ncbi:MAG: MoaD/ThiS family protein [Desulfovibrio sp.]|jgi:molybdopterin converting factor small subunit|nr:MoaD/ThiS family protein [Desulfovibrio sp.]
MRVLVTLSTTLRDHVPGYNAPDGLSTDLDSPADVKTLLTLLGIPENETKIIMVNGRQAALRDPLSDGDRVALFPAVGGG